MLALGIALTLHLLSAVVWVGGMFAAYLCLRPAAGPLEPPQRLALWRRFLAKFFPWVWVSVVLLLVTGFWMLLSFFGGLTGGCSTGGTSWTFLPGFSPLSAWAIARRTIAS